MNSNQEIFLRTIKNNPVKIANKLGFTLLGDLHNEWLKSFLFGKNDETLQAHRGSYKTVTISVALALMIVIYPNDSILFMRKTENDITEVMKSVSKMLHSDIMKAIVKVLYNKDLILLKDTNAEISTNLQTSTRGTAQLTGLGSTSSLTGKHYEKIFTDDIINLKDRTSKAERERIKLVYQELQNLKNRGGRIVNTGTPWSKEDAFSIMPKAVMYDCYSTGLIDFKELQEIRNKMTPSLFAANYELKHIAAENALFTNPQYTDNVELIYNGFAHIDARYSGEDTSAFTIIKQQKDGSFIGYGKMFDKHIDNCLSEIYALHEHYRAGTICLETNADKGYLARDISNAKKPVMTYHEKQNKHIKIASYLYKHWNNIKWLEDTDPNYLNQILDYQEGQEPDDCPDSAASLVRLITNGSYTKVIGKRPF